MPDGLDKNLNTLPQYIKEAGYSAHMVGKWHLGQGHEYDMPWNRGFDSYLGILEAQANYFTHRMGKIHCLRDDFNSKLRTIYKTFEKNQKEIKMDQCGDLTST